MENKKKLQVKDLMTVGIFATIYIVVKVIVGFVGVLELSIFVQSLNPQN